MHSAFLEELLNITRHMIEIDDLDELLSYTLSVVVDLVNAQSGHLILLDDSGNYQFRTSHTTFDDDIEQNQISTTILEQALATQETILLTDALANAKYREAKSVSAYQLRSVMVVPLISQTHLLGAIYVENRTKAAMFYDKDLELLKFFANQTASAIRNALLAAQVQKSRERIILAREEERRRLHRDLHDGVGPSLATMTLRIETIRNYLQNEPPKADAMLRDLKENIKVALGDIRQIVYDLRPPALAELGLLSALREKIISNFDTEALHVSLLAPPELPPLSAAAEVAIYRIVLEALTNVVKHAQAKACNVSLSVVDDAVMISIADDGVGMPDQKSDGVGLASIRDRALELGGQLTIERQNDQGGATLHIRVPY